MTRYPKNGKGTKWTIKELNAIKPDWKGDTLSDGEGLYGEVRVSKKDEVSIRFKYAFRWLGKTEWYQCGTYPTIELGDIRKERDFAALQVAEGIYPKAKKQAELIEKQNVVEATIAADLQKRTENLTVKDLFDVWIKDGVNRADGNKFIINSFEKHALPVIGKKPLKDLTDKHLLDIYKAIIARGNPPTAVELSKDIKQMLTWGEKRKPWRALMIDGNPSDLVDIKKHLPADYTKERDRVLSIEEIVALNKAFRGLEESYAEATSKYDAVRPIKKEIELAMWLCLSTMCRIGELLLTEWKHVDLEERTWYIPKENSKGERGKKRDQTVYLSDFALDKFKQLKALTGESQWVFPARYNEGHVCLKSASKIIGDRQTQFKKRTKKLKCRVENNSLVVGDREWTPHDLRRTGATMMQKLKVPRDVINMCQNHVVGSKVDRHYLHHDFAEEKREAWYKLGDWLQAIIQSTNVVELKQRA